MTDRESVTREMTFEEEAELYEKEARAVFAKEDKSSEPPEINSILRRGMRIIRKGRELIANGVTVQKWIPISARLPKDGECVLIWCGSYIEIGWYDADDKLWKSDYVNDYEGDVTHWMPLPPPPKESEEE